MTNNYHPHHLYADTPIRSTKEDLIGRSEVVETILRALNRIIRNEDSSVIALTGPWGSGKTSILNALDSELEKQTETSWHVVHHTPWMFSSPEAAIRSLYEELTGALGTADKTTKAREKAAGLFRKIAPFGAAGGVVGIDGNLIMQSAANLLEGDRPASQLLKELGQEFSKDGDYFLVIMDDLDRLEPNELLNTFRTVRLLGRMPQVHYILSYDEETLTDLLCRTQLTPTPPRARDYLEKMTQLRIDLPPLELDVRTSLFRSYLKLVRIEHKIRLTEEDEVRLHGFWYDVMSFDLDQPRIIKRYVGALDNLWEGMSGRVNFVDYMAMTYLRMQWKSLYDAIYESRYLLLGVNLSLLSEKSPGERHKEWSQQVEALALGESTQRLIGLTAMLFPALGRKRNYASIDVGIVGFGEERGVGDPAYFERYFQNGRYSNNVSDVAVARDLVLMASGSDSNRYISDALRRAPEATLDAVKYYAARATNFPSQTVFDTIGLVYDPTVRSVAIDNEVEGIKYADCGSFIISTLEFDEAAALLKYCFHQKHTRRLALRICRSFAGQSHKHATIETAKLYETLRDDYIFTAKKFIYDGITSHSDSMPPNYFAAIVFDLHATLGKSWDPDILWDDVSLVEEFDWLLRMVLPEAFPQRDQGALFVSATNIDSLLGREQVIELCRSIISSTGDEPVPCHGAQDRTLVWSSPSATEEWRIKANIKKVLKLMSALP